MQEAGQCFPDEDYESRKDANYVLQARSVVFVLDSYFQRQDTS